MQNRHAIGRELKIDLDPARASGQRILDPGEGVLDPAAGATSVGDEPVFRDCLDLWPLTLSGLTCLPPCREQAVDCRQE